MQGFDPRALADVTVRDPYDPTNPHGVSPDLSWEIRQLTSAVKAGGLVSAPIGAVAPDDETEIQKTSLVVWLKTQGYDDLADELDTSPPTIGSGPPGALTPSAPALPDPVRRLQALRDLGGNAKWLTMKWRFTKIKALVAQEKRTNKSRSDEKTIRKDLTEAADAESMVKRNGLAP